MNPDSLDIDRIPKGEVEYYVNALLAEADNPLHHNAISYIEVAQRLLDRFPEPELNENEKRRWKNLQDIINIYKKEYVGCPV